jgi:hypothetical protein
MGHTSSWDPLVQLPPFNRLCVCNNPPPNSHVLSCSLFEFESMMKPSKTKHHDENRRISSMDEYSRLFGEPGTSSWRHNIEQAWSVAVDNRRVEIDLYWKRATYFWTFNGVAFAGYFAISRDSTTTVSIAHFVVTCIGALFSLGWYVAMRGAKFWHQNWERHVDILENFIGGPIHKTVVRFDALKKYQLLRPYPFSMTKINAALGIFATLIWLFLGCRIVSQVFERTEPFKGFNFLIFGGVTIVFGLVAVFGSGTGREPWNIDFELRSIRSPDLDRVSSNCATSENYA